MEKELWIRYKNYNSFKENEGSLYDILGDHKGDDSVVIYCEEEKAVKKLSRNRSVNINDTLVSKMKSIYKEESIAVRENKI